MEEILKDIELFKNVSDDYLQRVLNRCKKIDLDKGEYLFRKGDVGDGMYVIVDGEVEVLVGKKQNHVVSTLTNKHTIGEISLLGKQTRIASARTKTPTSVLFLHFSEFSEQITNSNIDALRVVHNLAITIADRLEKSNELLNKLAQQDETKRAKREVSRYKEQLLEEGLF